MKLTRNDIIRQRQKNHIKNTMKQASKASMTLVAFLALGTPALTTISVQAEEVTVAQEMKSDIQKAIDDKKPYIVKKGDTLSSIVKAANEIFDKDHQVTIKQVAEWSKIDNVDLIHVDDEIFLFAKDEAKAETRKQDNVKPVASKPVASKPVTSKPIASKPIDVSKEKPVEVTKEQPVVEETTKEAVKPAPVVEETTKEAVKPAPVADGTYKVQKGDYLYKIAQKFGVTVEQLKEWNKLTSNLIFTGDQLVVKAPKKDAVKPAPKPVVEETTKESTKPTPVVEETTKEVVKPTPKPVVEETTKEQVYGEGETYTLLYLDNGKTQYKAKDAKSAEEYFKVLMQMNGIDTANWSWEYDAQTRTFKAKEAVKPVVEETTKEVVKPDPKPVVEETTTEVVKPKPIDEVVPGDEVVEETPEPGVDEPVTPKPVFKPFNLDLIRSHFHTLLNDHRIANGVSPIQVGIQLLQDAANQRAQEMADYGDINYVSPDGTELPHHRPDGTYFLTVLPEEIKQDGIGEIIAVTSTSGFEDGRNQDRVMETDGTFINEQDVAQKLFNRWKNSPAHNSAMIDENNKTYAFGIGFKEVELIPEDAPDYVKQEFAGHHAYRVVGVGLTSRNTPAAEESTAQPVVPEVTAESLETTSGDIVIPEAAATTVEAAQ